MVRALDGEHADKLDLQKVSRELYEVLATITEGDAKLMVKNVFNNDRSVGVSPSPQALQQEDLGESTSHDQGGIAPEGPARLEAAHFKGGGVGGQMGQDGGRTQRDTP